ncbi:NAD(P)/FAD-dependent oxidoreductase [Agrococcus sp. DT81.2]|uniref:NAD(P)/FAD-dependent oxidoreductase n=1 Tax=Agrococcus sp. DT81.2 TaxID=3393414 RepID=UPI003CE4783A
MTDADVAIVGGGIVGTALASELVRRGRRVALVDSGRAGTTAASYGWINSHKKHPIEYHQLNMAGVAAWRAIADRHPSVVSFAGHLEIAEDEAHRRSLTQRVERLQELGYGARWSSVADARDAVRCTIAPDSLVAAFDEGHAFPLRWVAHLSDQLASADGFERRRATVTRIEPGRYGAELVLEDESRIRATDAVVCAGNGSEALVASAGGALPLVEPLVDSAAFGYLADVSAPGHGIDRMVTTDVVGIRPGDDDLLLVQALDLDQTAEVGAPAPPGVATALEQRIAALLPHTAPRVRAIRVGHRVIPADGRTAAGRIRAGSRVWAIVTHSGVVLAPWLASVLADELCGAPRDARLASFQPARFLDGDAATAPTAPRRPGDQ